MGPRPHLHADGPGWARAAAAAARHAAADAGWLVACSGGPDSQALLHWLSWGPRPPGLGRLQVAGVDHGLRPAAAAELDLAEALAAGLGLPFHRLRVRLDGAGNLLAQARRARYAALAQLAAAHRLSWIVTGHSADDQLETVLHHLCRGSGTAGAAGMRARSGGLWRPLLGVGREQLRRYLQGHQLAYALDPSNQHPGRFRAAIRQQLAPALAALRPRVAQQVARFAGHAAADDRLLRRQAGRRLQRWRQQGWAGCAPEPADAEGPAAAPWPLSWLPQARLERLPRPLFVRLVAAWLRPYLRANGPLLAALWAARRRQRWRRSAGAWLLSHEAGRCWLSRPAARRPAPAAAATATDAGLRLHLPGRTTMPGRLGTVRARQMAAGALPPHDPDALCVAFDRDHLHPRLTVRCWQAGDRLGAFGLGGGHITVGNLFTNLKVPTPLRRLWPVVVAGSTVAWVPGLARAALAPIRSDTTWAWVLTFEGGCVAVHGRKSRQPARSRSSRS